MIINQWVPAAHKGDATGDSARRVRDLLREMGHESDLFAMTMDDDLKGDVRPLGDPAARLGEATIFHFAVASIMTDAFATLDGARVLQYHNVTPAHYFAPYAPALFRLASIGRTQLAMLAGRVDLALGDSEYNRQELEALGFAPTGVFPLALDTSRVTQRVRRPALETILGDDELVNFLFVGRIAPNKKIEDHIRLAEHYKRYVDACRSWRTPPPPCPRRSAARAYSSPPRIWSRRRSSSDRSPSTTACERRSLPVSGGGSRTSATRASSTGLAAS